MLSPDESPPPARCDLVGGVEAVARGLLGVEVHSYIDGVHTAGRIVETEAYRGADDKAAHSYKHKRTKRTEVFFGDAGHAYVYLIYGVHEMFNVVTGPVGQPDAVLVRAVEPVIGREPMRARRKRPVDGPRLTNGPALVCQALGITREHYGADLTDPRSPVHLRGRLHTLTAENVLVSPRVGVAYAEECAGWPWRFRVSGNLYTSPAK